MSEENNKLSMSWESFLRVKKICAVLLSHTNDSDEVKELVSTSDCVSLCVVNSKAKVRVFTQVLLSKPDPAPLGMS